MLSLLFDLDGTLIDTSSGIIKGIEYAESVLNLNSIPYDVKKSFIGPPLFDSFVKYYELPESTAKDAVKEFRRYYSDRGKYEAVPYSGMKELLENIDRTRTQVFVATSKPTEFAKDIISFFGIEECFEGIIGSNMDNTRSKKSDIIDYILSEYGCERDTTIMIGDKEQDINGARKAGVKSIGVTYGFGSEEEIRNSKPDYIATSVKELAMIIHRL